jgi:hypothetical protein
MVFSWRWGVSEGEVELAHWVPARPRFGGMCSLRLPSRQEWCICQVYTPSIWTCPELEPLDPVQDPRAGSAIAMPTILR